MYNGEISMRLESFMWRKCEMIDIGGPEYGPELSISYAGPVWASMLADAAQDPGKYEAEIGFENMLDNEEL